MLKAFRNIRRAAVTFLAAAIVVAGLLAFLPPAPAHAGILFSNGPDGTKVMRNSGANVAKQARVNPMFNYGCQVSGPFVLSVTSVTASVIRPASVATNLVDGSSYQGTFRILFTSTQQVQFQPTSLTYGPGVTYTAGTLGYAVAANALGDSNSFGEMWPGGGVALQLSPTVSGTANNVVYWVEDFDW